MQLLRHNIALNNLDLTSKNSRQAGACGAEHLVWDSLRSIHALREKYGRFGAIVASDCTYRLEILNTLLTAVGALLVEREPTEGATAGNTGGLLMLSHEMRYEQRTLPPTASSGGRRIDAGGCESKYCSMQELQEALARHGFEVMDTWMSEAHNACVLTCAWRSMRCCPSLGSEATETAAQACSARRGERSSGEPGGR
jgi:hypothetical protein